VRLYDISGLSSPSGQAGDLLDSFSVSVSNNQVQVIDYSAQRGERITALAFSASGQCLLVASVRAEQSEVSYS
jgi:hypothetical protein